MKQEDVRILVVDDVNSMRVQIKDMLRKAGFKNVHSVSTTQEAKRQLEIEKFDLVMSDWRIEPTDGLDLLKYIRIHPEQNKLTFIMVTAEDAKDLVIQAIKAGVDDYVVKPVSPVQIQAKVIEVLTKKGLI
ncbi:MAG: hypothetical protein A2583_12200 [Bdellovibrionales bacterium RIFOXYD1_FULL_53_11]|nr:MAG: hypothetical protein A2583_12200 [Bdellovibrionales bacterium RIFOXYD1_FULL_53_11]